MWLKSGSLLHDSPSVLEAETTVTGCTSHCVTSQTSCMGAGATTVIRQLLSLVLPISNPGHCSRRVLQELSRASKPICI